VIDNLKKIKIYLNKEYKMKNADVTGAIYHTKSSDNGKSLYEDGSLSEKDGHIEIYNFHDTVRAKDSSGKRVDIRDSKPSYLFRLYMTAYYDHHHKTVMGPASLES